MNEGTLQAAITEAERFLVIALQLQVEYRNHNYPSGKISGATRRASMDLTRALADLRRPM